MLKLVLPAADTLESVAGDALKITGSGSASLSLPAGDKEATRPRPGSVKDQSHRGDASRTDGGTSGKAPPAPPKKKPGLY